MRVTDFWNNAWVETFDKMHTLMVFGERGGIGKFTLADSEGIVGNMENDSHGYRPLLGYVEIIYWRMESQI